MGFIWFLGGVLTALLLLFGAVACYCAGLAAAEKRKKEQEAPDIELYNEMWR